MCVPASHHSSELGEREDRPTPPEEVPFMVKSRARYQAVPAEHQAPIHLVKFICFLSLLLPAPLCSHSVFFSPPYLPVIFFMTLQDISQSLWASS